jgi:hypothetical protein
MELGVCVMNMSMHEVVAFLEKNFKYADQGHRDRLRLLVGETEPKFKVDTNLDMLQECHEQMALVRMLRSRVSASGMNGSTKDLKDLISASTALFSMLTKYSSDITNQDSIKKIEAATVAAISTLSPAIQNKFFAELGKRLE